jgi:hypothetical protein
MKLCGRLFAVLAAIGAVACNLSPGYDLPSAGGKNDEGDGQIDVGGDGDENRPASECAAGGAGGEGGTCSMGESTDSAKSE